MKADVLLGAAAGIAIAGIAIYGFQAGLVGYGAAAVCLDTIWVVRRLINRA